MEQIKVNMTPCGFTPTIHASQNDDATRKWAFDLYDENGKIDSSSIKEQMIFDSRVGGTEQILPENTSNPTTSPIIADIQYPDSLRSEQTFLYRESPTTVNGQSKITHIKGNTVVFNQLVQNGNFADTSAWVRSHGTYTASNNMANCTATESAFQLFQGLSTTISLNHKVYLSIQILGSTSHEVRVRLSQDNPVGFHRYVSKTITANTWTTISGIITEDVSVANSRFSIFINDSANGETYSIKNCMCIDLTKMGLDTLTVDQFTSLYPLPYYDYTQGKLLPFKGESLKTTGKNKLSLTLSELKTLNTNGTWNNNIYNRNGVDFSVISNEEGYVTEIVANGLASGNGDFVLKSYQFEAGNKLSGSVGGSLSTYGIALAGAGIVQTDNDYIMPQAYTTEAKTVYIRICSGYNAQNVLFHPMIRSADADAVFEPYTSSTINLPTLNYFPTGMKSAGSVYDEITESKAITRLISYTITGNETVYRWENNTSSAFGYHYGGSIVLELPVQNAGNVGLASGGYTIRFQNADKTIYFSNDKLIIIDDRYTTRDAWIAGITGVEVILPLITETEQRITTASLVTEKGESPLYYDDELIADCNETISSESGIFDAKIKLMNDETIYSQKIQLHVERKP